MNCNILYELLFLPLFVCDAVYMTFDSIAKIVVPFMFIQNTKLRYY